MKENDRELTVSKLTVQGGDGFTAVVLPTGITISGPSGRIEASFFDGAPSVKLFSPDGEHRAEMRAEKNATAVALHSGDNELTLQAGGLVASNTDAQIALSPYEFIARGADRSKLFSVAFHAFGWLGTLLAKFKAILPAA